MEHGTGNKERGFRRLRAWQKADELACAIFQITSFVPREHQWLRNQVVRAAVSVPANMAEGYSRGGLRDYLRFLDIARGSLGELEYYVHFLEKNGIINKERLAQLNALRAETGSLLFGLTQALRDKVREQGPWQRGLVRDDPLDYLSAME